MLKSNEGKRELTERAFIAIGSNIEPERYLPLAVHQLADLGVILACSEVYQNPAIASEPQPDYLNAAVLIKTSLEPLEIRTHLRQIESNLDRVRTEEKYAPRTIDLDLCLYGDLQWEDADLTLPDPDVLTRPFLALTLSELAPDFIYPGTDLTLESLATNLMQGITLEPRPDVRKEIDQLKGAGS